VVGLVVVFMCVLVVDNSDWEFQRFERGTAPQV
jgi:hypothetical protein